MEDRSTISIIAEYIKGNYYEYEIKDLLKNKDISESNFKVLFEKAKEIVFNDSLRKYQKKNKLFYFIFLSLIILTYLLVEYLFLLNF